MFLRRLLSGNIERQRKESDYRWMPVKIIKHYLTDR